MLSYEGSGGEEHVAEAYASLRLRVENQPSRFVQTVYGRTADLAPRVPRSHAVYFFWRDRWRPGVATAVDREPYVFFAHVLLSPSRRTSSSRC